jgi:hypothetical protein
MEVFRTILMVSRAEARTVPTAATRYYIRSVLAEPGHPDSLRALLSVSAGQGTTLNRCCGKYIAVC